MQNLKITLKDSRTLAAITKLQYLFTLLLVEALCQFDNLCAHMGVRPHHFGFRYAIFPVNFVSK